ncbi:hypothetical protein GQR58_002195 [Nymphon striatum]|nr:hypothetical protein GQR58_002195 [Nymphon striatum]
MAAIHGRKRPFLRPNTSHVVHPKCGIIRQAVPGILVKLIVVCDLGLKTRICLTCFNGAVLYDGLSQGLTHVRFDPRHKFNVEFERWIHSALEKAPDILVNTVSGVSASEYQSNFDVTFSRVSKGGSP